MNCNAALEAMLDAEPQELSGQGSTPLAGHLASCRKCRSVGERLVNDTRLLATTAGRSELLSHRPRARWVQRSLVPVGLVATLLVLLLRSMPNAPTGTSGVAARALPSVVPTDPAVPSTVASREIAPPNATTRTRAYPASEPIPPIRITAVSLPPATPAGSAATVTVEPPAGRRVAVMRTDNPKFTVVWLY